MKKIIVSTILLLLASCGNTNPSEKEFEAILGEELVVGLNESVDIFEKMLAEYYHSEMTSSLYIQFLNDVRTKELDWNKFFENKVEFEATKQAVIQSGLYDELVYKFGGIIDSNEWLVERKYYYQPKYSQVSVDSITIGINKGKLDSTYTIEGDIEFIHFSKIQYALLRVKNSNQIIKDYLDAKNSAGMIRSYLVAGGLLNKEPLKLDYFIKRIIVNEFLLYKACSSIYDEKN